jgi:bacillithiol biosynthesis deacetylase BshB1
MPDILAIAAHPDDIELNSAGTLLKARADGQTFAICDLTQGERGTRGSMELRAEETARANRVLGVEDGNRWNLKIPDGNIEVNEENRLKVVRAIRHFRPKVLLLPWDQDRHPDHVHAHHLIREASFDAGLRHVETEWNGQIQHPHRPEKMYCFFHTYERTPDFVIDVSDYIEGKLAAIAAYSSQFTVPGLAAERNDDPEPRTFISGTDFIEAILGRMRHWGFMVGVRYAEAYCTISGPLKVRGVLETI